MTPKETIAAIKSWPVDGRLSLNAHIALNLDAYGDPISAFVKSDDSITVVRLHKVLDALLESHERLEAALRQIDESFNTRDRHPADHMLRVLGIAKSVLNELDAKHISE